MLRVAQKLRVHKAVVGTDTIQHQGPGLRSVGDRQEGMGHSAVTRRFLQS